MIEISENYNFLPKHSNLVFQAKVRNQLITSFTFSLDEA